MSHLANLSQENLLKNQQHFDHAYAIEDAAALVKKLRDFDAFFSSALRVDTSWRGLYQRDLVPRLAGKKVFEVGCGDGLNALVMAQLGAHVTANDIAPSSQPLLESAARELGLSDRINVIIGDFPTLGLPARGFDFVIGKNLLHHLTHEQETAYLAEAAQVLAPTGEARFFEPALNAQWLESLRLMTPLPDRPARWQAGYAEWKRDDPHPERDNSTAHYLRSGQRFFAQAEVTPLGSLERLSRLIPKNLAWRKRFRAWAHDADERLPYALRLSAARSQLIVYRQPRA